jgi:rhamnosyltransferase
LLRLCENLLAAGSEVVLVDNTEMPCTVDQQQPSGCQLIALGLNAGIAHAQNIGITTAIAAGAEVVAFFDQDSTIKPGFITALVSPLHVGRPDVVAPLYVDDASNLALPSTSVNRYGVSSAIHNSDSLAPYPVDVVISSGTTATKEVFEMVGLFDEDFFIDFVDTEWCLRCRSKHIPIRVIPTAVMHHRIGSKSINFGFTTVFVHSSVRCYYQVRNCFHLFRKRHIPILFALRETISVFVSRTLLLLIVDDKLAYAKAYLCALRDGFKGVTGVKPE